MNWPEAPPLAAAEQGGLLEIAALAIAAGLDVPWFDVDLAALPPRLALPGASFVSLHRAGRLRGCMGRLEPSRPLAEDVAGNARAAAYFDPRFAPLAADERDDLELEISVLGRPEPLVVADEAELLALLRPGIDGLIVHERGRRATFLPAVWRQLPEPRDFIRHLARKAGLSPATWGSGRRFERYAVECFAAGPGAVLRTP